MQSKYPKEYLEAILRPADEEFDYTATSTESMDRVFLRNQAGVAIGWVLPNLLSTQECTDVIAKAEQHGIAPPRKSTGRTSKRTEQYIDEELSQRVLPRMTEAFCGQIERDGGDDYDPAIAKLQQNWRVVRYDCGDAFAAHQDQMDTEQVKDKATGKKDLLASTHTLLIQLSPDAVEGGATRFFPKKHQRPSSKNDGTKSQPYDYAVDVKLPTGWGLVFFQRGLLHAGQPVLKGCKYVAQSGVMRLLPAGVPLRPSVFKVGPMLDVLQSADPNDSQQQDDKETLAFFEDPNRPSLLPPHLA